LRTFLEVKDLHVYFPIRTGFFGKITGYVKAVDGVTFEVGKGEIFALVGESGSGKSTTLKAILKLVPIYSGRIVFDGMDITNLKEKETKWYRKRVQAVFQNPQTSLNPRMKVFDIIAEPLKLHLKLRGEELRKKVYELIKLVGLPESILNQYPVNLSGGQAQRVAIARAISINPELLLLDEPTSALDISTQAQILNLLLDLKENLNLSYILVTHDISIAIYMANYIAVMYLGKIMEKGSAEKVLPEPLHPYTKLLIASAILTKNEKTIEEPPNIFNPSTGCKFYPRCPYTIDICRKEEPPLIEIEKDRYISCWLFNK
jgi:oligopeptide/dipeptide ABC transporter ATP-binding protein